MKSEESFHLSGLSCQRRTKKDKEYFIEGQKICGKFQEHLQHLCSRCQGAALVNSSSSGMLSLQVYSSKQNFPLEISIGGSFNKKVLNLRVHGAMSSEQFPLAVSIEYDGNFLRSLKSIREDLIRDFKMQASDF